MSIFPISAQLWKLFRNNSTVDVINFGRILFSKLRHPFDELLYSLNCLRRVMLEACKIIYREFMFVVMSIQGRGDFEKLFNILCLYFVVTLQIHQ